MPSETIIVAIISVISAIVTSIIASIVGYRKLKTELLAKQRMGLVEKQTEACENLWSMIKPQVYYDNDGNYIPNPYENPPLEPAHSWKMAKDLMDVFYSKDGLYMSKNLRDALFEFRSVLINDFVLRREEIEKNGISNRLRKKSKKYVTRLRIAIREELNLIDPEFAKKGLLEN